MEVKILCQEKKGGRCLVSIEDSLDASLQQFEDNIQSVSPRIWTRVTVSISYDDNHYTAGISSNRYIDINIVVPTSYDFKILNIKTFD